MMLCKIKGEIPSEGIMIGLHKSHSLCLSCNCSQMKVENDIVM